MNSESTLKKILTSFTQIPSFILEINAFFASLVALRNANQINLKMTKNKIYQFIGTSIDSSISLVISDLALVLTSNLGGQFIVEYNNFKRIKQGGNIHEKEYFKKNLALKLGTSKEIAYRIYKLLSIYSNNENENGNF